MQHQPEGDTNQLFLRIAACWAFSEAFLGGILHGLHLPFAGLILALMASLCISLLATQVPGRGIIMKATLLVIAVKFALSPNTPPAAYWAVGIQGLAGELFFLNRRRYAIPVFALTVFSQLYSAFQHLIILTIIFGKGFWQATDIFLNKITAIFISSPQQYSVYLVSLYVSAYLIAGIAGGIFNMRLIHKISTKNFSAEIISSFAVAKNSGVLSESFLHPGKGKKHSILFGIGVLFLVVLFLSYIPSVAAGISKSKALLILARGLLILVAWIYCISPLLMLLVEKWMQRYRQKKSKTIQQIIALLPEMRMIIRYSWQYAQQRNKWGRLKNTITTAIILVVYDGR